jgi:sigma-B regulation protein RsbU (phosphoserine phosphatase)
MLTPRPLERFRSLSRIDQAFLIALVLRVAYWLVEAGAGARLPGDGVVRFLFIAAGILFLAASFPRLMRKLLWRVRHRLLVTWVFVGVVPIVLICILVALGLFFLMGQASGYMTTSEIARQSDLLRSSAQTLAWTIVHSGKGASLPALTETFLREASKARQTEVGAIVRNGQDTFAVPADGNISAIPPWSKPDFLGLIKDSDRYYLGAHVVLEDSTRKTEVFLYQRASAAFFKSLLPGVATIEPADGQASATGINIRRTEKPQSKITFSSSRDADEDPDIQEPLPPPGRGWWDIAVNWFILLPNTNLSDGKVDATPAVVVSRPSLVVGKLFSTLGDVAWIFFMLMAGTAILLLVVEIVSVLFGAKLTRSITRAVADLYEGTRKVQAGDFSHRIPVRKTKDQLSELAGSFNVMTGRIQDLIVEVKEKERLENELAIARDVQSQLFPKQVPHLKTLELWGACQPARTVSGDYYDFVSLDSNRAALAIGDISGKGISAALLMAHIQSALRSQLMRRNGDGDNASAGISISPANVLSILNEHLYGSSPAEKYATFFLGLYADDDAQLLYTNAGHLAPMLVRRGKVQRLAGEGFPVGLFPGVRYDQQSIALEPGDLLVGFTDGITETPNGQGEEFGDQRLIELLAGMGDKALDRIAGEITSSVASWAGDAERHDDTTLLLARRL